MTDSSILTWSLLGWMLAAGAAVFLRMRRGRASSGLLLAYVVSLASINWLAPVLYLIPDNYLSGFDGLARGMRICAIAMLAFALGVILWELSRRREARQAGRSEKVRLLDIPPRLLLLSAVAYALTYTWVGRLPTITSLLGAFSALLALAIVWKLFLAYRQRAWKRFAGWFGLIALFPFVTTAVDGFLGFGAGVAVLITCHVVGFARKRARLLPAAAVLVYLGLSVYVTYMRDRSDIREAVWGGMPLSVRVEQIISTFRRFEWFDPGDALHEQLVDTRLNQVQFVGRAAGNIDSGMVDFARGRTIWEAAMALIPRAVWSGKPVFAGSSGIVTEYTGIVFAESTSVGATQVMESYINFGMPGVCVIFFLFGFVLSAADSRAGEALRACDLETFVRWSLPAVALLNVSGSFVEISASAAASLALFWILKSLGLFGGGRFRAGRARGTAAVPAPKPVPPLPYGVTQAGP